jgi:hypothetical protein
MAPRSAEIRKHFCHVAGSCDTSSVAASRVRPTISRGTLERLGRRLAGPHSNLRSACRDHRAEQGRYGVSPPSAATPPILAPTEVVRQIVATGFNHKKHVGWVRLNDVSDRGTHVDAEGRQHLGAPSRGPPAAPSPPRGSLACNTPAGACAARPRWFWIRNSRQLLDDPTKRNPCSWRNIEPLHLARHRVTSHSWMVPSAVVDPREQLGAARKQE